VINWQDKDWSYLLGVIHGDGSIAPRSIDISVGYGDRDYADMLMSLWESLGYSPKMYRPRSALKVSVHSKALRDELAPFKQKGLWSWPEGLCESEYLSGVFDADGWASSLPGGSKRIGITLKRSGNLKRLASYLDHLGILGVTVKESVRSYNGRPYEVESILICDSARISQFGDLMNLRHARKAAMFDAVYQRARNYLNRVPLWRKVGLWLAEEPRNWREIAQEFNLSRDQVDSVLGNLRKKANIQTTPQVIILAKYEVGGWKDK